MDGNKRELNSITAKTKTSTCLSIFVIIHTLLFMGLFMVPARFFYPKTGELELYFSSKIFAGQVPYRDFPVEYPPLSLLFFLIPRVFFDTLPAYSFAFAFELLVADIIILYLICCLAPRLKVSPWYLLGVYTLLVLGVGPLIMSRYDLWPATLVLVALLVFTKGMTKLTWLAIALSITAKLYGAVIVPLFVIYHLLNKQYKRLLEGSIVFLATSLVLTLPWLILNLNGFLYSLGYHLERGLHSESSYGTFLLVGQLLGITKVYIGYASGSWNLYSPLAGSLAKISVYLSAISLLAVYAAFAWTLWTRRKTALEGKPLWLSDTALIFQFSSLAVLVLLLTAKVLSAQYLIRNGYHNVTGKWWRRRPCLCPPQYNLSS